MIDSLLLFKILGVAIVTVSSIVALFGDTTTNGKLNIKGYVLMTLVVFGTATSIWIEIHQNEIENTQKIIDNEWKITENQPIFKFEFSIAFRQQFARDDFKCLIRKVAIKYTVNEPNEIGRYEINTIKVSKLNKNILLKDLYKLVNYDIRNQILGKPGTYFYPYFKDSIKVSNNTLDSFPKNPKIIVGGDKKLGSYYVVVGKSFSVNDWIYTSNIDFDWTLVSSKMCGFSADLPWKYFNSNHKLNSISDLVNIASFTVKIPDAIDLEKIDQLNFEFQTSDNQNLHCNLLTFKDSNSKKENLISFSGFQLYNAIKEEFSVNGGRKVADMEIR